jgi:hypothetical protein
MVPAGSVELQRWQDHERAGSARWQGKTGREITDLIMVHDAGQDRSPFAAGDGSDFKRQATVGASVAGVGVVSASDGNPLPGGAVMTRCLFGCSGKKKGSTALVPPAAADPYRPARSAPAKEAALRRGTRRLLVPVTEIDAALGQVVGRHLDRDPVARQDPDAVFAHLAR